MRTCILLPALLIALSAPAVALASGHVLHFSAEPSPEHAVALALLEAERQEPIAPELVSIALVDLDQDGRDDLFAFADASYFCGSAGCIPRLYLVRDNGWLEAPIDGLVNGEPHMWTVADELHHGWLVLVFDGPGGRTKLAWDGEAYAEMP